MQKKAKHFMVSASPVLDSGWLDIVNIKHILHVEERANQQRTFVLAAFKKKIYEWIWNATANDCNSGCIMRGKVVLNPHQLKTYKLGGYPAYTMATCHQDAIFNQV